MNDRRISLLGPPSCRLTPIGQPQKDEGGSLIYYYRGDDGREYSKTVYPTDVERWHQQVPLRHEKLGPPKRA